MWAGHSWTALLSIFPTHLKEVGGRKKKNFSSFTTVNAGFWQGHKSTEETERKYSHKLLGWNVTSHDIPANGVIRLSVDVAAGRAARAS